MISKFLRKNVIHIKLRVVELCIHLMVLLLTNLIKGLKIGRIKLQLIGSSQKRLKNTLARSVQSKKIARVKLLEAIEKEDYSTENKLSFVLLIDNY